MDPLKAPTCKLFTIDEANTLLPYLQDALETLQKRVQQIVSLRRQIDVLNLICDPGLAHDNKDAVELADKTALYHRLVGEADGIIRAIRIKGCLLRDVQTGIVDFYSRNGDRIVYLCWRKDETSISHWHPVGEGYGKRRMLDGQKDGARGET